jgi:magnesium chelatase subunit D
MISGRQGGQLLKREFKTGNGRTRVQERAETADTGAQMTFNGAARASDYQFPFAAIVGMTAAKRALLLLAIDPQLKGVLFSNPSGSASSALTRAFGAVFSTAGNGRRHRAIPIIKIPLNVAEDRLLGGADFEHVLANGKPTLLPGLLAQANGGLMIVDDINLLDAAACDRIAAALDSEVMRVEREGLSAILDARFALVGTYDLREGETSNILRERVGLIVESSIEYSSDELSEIASRALRFEKDPAGFVQEFAFETASLNEAIADARLRLGKVQSTSGDIRRIAEASIRLGVEGNRADALAIRAARANAALSGRDCVSDEDLVLAIQLVLLPRAKRLPADEAGAKKNAEPQQDESSPSSQEPEASHSDSEKTPDSPEDLVIAALDAFLPEDALLVASHKDNRLSAGRRADSTNAARGRYWGSGTRLKNNSRIAIDATLRAAALFQASRRASAEIKKQNDTEPPRMRETGIQITKSDLRFKRLRSKSGILFIFAVDASGSMALNRMAQAKGAVTRLLQQAYLHRDKVALISFRRAEAEILLAPTRSIELAKRLVDAMPTGGTTPIALALEKGMEIARLARLRGMPHAMLVLLTDGRANVGMREDKTGDKGLRATTIAEELRVMGAALNVAGITSVVIDTKSSFVSSGEGRKLAELLGGRYLYLPRADSEAICDAVKAVAEQARSKY